MSEDHVKLLIEVIEEAIAYLERLEFKTAVLLGHGAFCELPPEPPVLTRLKAVLKQTKE